MLDRCSNRWPRFHENRFSAAHEFEKPNDARALKLMNACAVSVMEEYADIVFAYGVSDEFSFVIKKSSKLYERRSSKLISLLVSLFSSNYVFKWNDFFPSSPLKQVPCFDARAICYPDEKILKHYLAWRQVDCHINNQYNTVFWALVHSGLSASEAQNEIKGTMSDFKNELLHSRFGCNYNDLPPMFRKGSCLYRKQVEEIAKYVDEIPIVRKRRRIVVEHEDIIRDSFWKENSQILNC